MVMGELLEAGMFVAIDTSNYAEHGVKRGDVAYLAGESMVPDGEGDGYYYRKFFVCAHVEGGHLNPDVKGFLADPKNLKALSKVKQDKLKAILQEDFGPKDEVMEVIDESSL